MTRNEFQTLCEDICFDESDEDWSMAETLSRIASEIRNVAIDFNSDVAMTPEFGEEISNV